MRWFLIVLMLASGVLSGTGQEPAAPGGSAQAPARAITIAPAPASVAGQPTSGEKLRLSSVLARHVSAALPAWTPPPALLPETQPPPDPELVAMKPFFVRSTPVKLSETDVLTDSGKLELAEKRYISPLYRVTFGPLSQVAAYYFNFLTILNGWHPNEAEAITLYREDERLQMLGDMDSLIRIEKIAAPEDAKEFQELKYEAAASSR
jgi:hypothetical protein